MQTLPTGVLPKSSKALVGLAAALCLSCLAVPLLVAAGASTLVVGAIAGYAEPAAGVALVVALGVAAVSYVRRRRAAKQSAQCGNCGC